MFLRPFGLYCSACFGSLCPSSIHVVATLSGTVLFPLYIYIYIYTRAHAHTHTHIYK